MRRSLSSGCENASSNPVCRLGSKLLIGLVVVVRALSHERLHVPPPRALSPGDGTHPQLPPGVSTYGDDYTRYGFRVPCVVVSPWARRDFVSHTVFDHTSVLRTIETKWNLPALTYRDANANDLRECLVGHGPAPFEEPPQLTPAPPSTPTGNPAA